jgi:gliding motility-associated-like protein
MKYLFIILFLIIGVNIYSQLDTVHWMPPLHSYSVTQDHYIYLSTPSPSPFSVTITDGGGTLLANPTISQGTPFRYDIGVDTVTQLFVSDGLLNNVQSNKGFILKGSQKFYANVRTQQTSQAGSITAKGRAGAGLNFRVGFMPVFLNGTSRNNFCSIMATENNTNVTLTGYDPGVVFDGIPTVSSNSLSFSLNEGETYTFSSRFNVVENQTGLIGSLLSSNRPIVVNTGNFLGTIDSTATGQDMALDQIVPVDIIGDEYVSIRGDGSNSMEKVLIIAHDDNTSIFMNGSTTPHIILNAGEWTMVGHSFYQGTGHKNMYINSSNPVYCFQFLGGSTSSATPGMNILAPISCDLSSRIDAIPAVDSIGSFPYTGGVFIVARAGSFVNLNGIGQTGSESIQGLTDWVTYKITGLNGDQVIESNGNLIAGIYGVNAAAGWAGYFSGFDRLPQEVTSLSNPVTLDSCGSVLLTVSPSYQSYNWYRNNTLLPSLAGDSNIVSQNGDYYVVMTNQFGCNDTAYNNNVVVYSVPTANAGVDTVLNCWTPVKELNGDLSSLGNNFNYSWTTLGGNIQSGSSTLTPLVDSVGYYIIEVTDVNTGCSNFDTLTVSIDTITPFINAGSDTLLTCFNPQIELISSGNLSSGQLYHWNTQNGTIVGNDSLTSVTVSKDGLYVYIVRDSTNGCASFDSVIVSIDTVTPIVVLNNDTLINCYDPEIVLSGVGSPSGGYSYEWTTSGGNIVNGENTLTPLVNDSGYYQLMITNNFNGCKSSDSLYVFLDNQTNASILINDLDTNSFSGFTLTDYNFSAIGSQGFMEWNINSEVKNDSVFIYNFDESGQYAITLAIENILNGCISYDTLTLDLIHELLIPSAVSADENGFNDSFLIKALENFDDSHLIIFNRWGSQVFEQSPYLNNWKGESNATGGLGGSQVSNGTYFYVLKLIDKENEYIYKGSIELIKE